MKETISDRIYRLRVLRGYSQQELAEKCGFSDRSAISRIESGKRDLKSTVIMKLADALGVSPAYLVNGDEKNLEKTVDLSKARPMTGYLPIYGVIAAGEPQFADENIIDYVLTDVKRPENYFGLKVKGDSMINAGITDGAYVIFEKSSDAEDNDIVACRVNGDEATLKRFRRHADSVLLMPENPKYSPIIVSASEFENGYAQIIGIAREIRFKI